MCFNLSKFCDLGMSILLRGKVGRWFVTKIFHINFSPKNDSGCDWSFIIFETIILLSQVYLYKIWIKTVLLGTNSSPRKNPGHYEHAQPNIFVTSKPSRLIIVYLLYITNHGYLPTPVGYGYIKKMIWNSQNLGKNGRNTKLLVWKLPPTSWCVA